MIDNKYVIENLLKLELKDIFALEFGRDWCTLHTCDKVRMAVALSKTNLHTLPALPLEEIALSLRFEDQVWKMEHSFYFVTNNK